MSVLSRQSYNMSNPLTHSYQGSIRSSLSQSGAQTMSLRNSVNLKPGNPLYYYPPEPRNTYGLDPMRLKSFKNLDVDEVQECFGRSLQQRKYQEMSKQAEIKKIFDEDKDIQLIKSSISQAQLNKYRALQIHNDMAKRMQFLVKDAETDEKVLEQLKHDEELEREKEKRRREKMLQAKYVIQQQMKDREKERLESKKELERDKQQIDDIVKKILQEDKNNYEELQRKKAISKSYMEAAYAEREEMKRRQKENERLEKEKERKYFEEVARREMEHNAKKKALQDSKDKIFEKLCAEKARQQAEKDYWEDVRNQLYDEENNRKNRIKELEEKEKQARQKEEMLQWAINQMKMKEERKND